MFNEPEEGGVQSHMGRSMHSFMIPKKERSMIFSCLESPKRT